LDDEVMESIVKSVFSG